MVQRTHLLSNSHTLHAGDIQAAWRALGKTLGRFAILTISALSIGWIWSAHSTARAPELVPSSPPVFFSDQNQDDLGSLLWQSLERAKKSVYLEIFTLSDPKILKTLNTLARKGVQVHVITDRQFAGSLSRMHKNVSVEIKPTSGIMHRKTLVIDGQDIWLGSANITDESLYLNHNFLLGVKSPELAQFLESGDTSSGQFTAAGQSFEIWLLPQFKEAADRLISALDQAKSSVRIAMFAWTRPEIADAAISAQARGVDVQVVLDRKQAQSISLPIARKLIAAGVPTRLSLGLPLLHYKFAWIDEQRLYTGSANWTQGGLHSNQELIAHFPQLTYSQQRWMTELWKRCWLEAAPGSPSPLPSGASSR